MGDLVVALTHAVQGYEQAAMSRLGGMANYSPSPLLQFALQCWRQFIVERGARLHWDAVANDRGEDLVLHAPRLEPAADMRSPVD